MGRSFRTVFFLPLGPLLACTFGGAAGDPGVASLGESMGDDAPATDDADDAGDGDAGSDDAGGSSTGPSAASFSDGDGDSGDGGGLAELVVEDGVSYTFAPTEVMTSADALLVVRNVGDGAASNVTPVAFEDASFAFVGGFPGQGGTCGAQLEAEQECLLGITFQPLTWGEKDAQLELSYDNGDEGTSSIPIFGRSHGLSANLVTNGEFDGNLNGWMDSPSSWQALWELEWVAYAGQNSGVEDFELTQIVSVADRAELIDAGALRVVFGGRSRATTGDEHRFELEFLGSGGSLGVVETPNFSSTSRWRPLDINVLVPAGTREIRYVAQCKKPSGSQRCDARFDDASIRLLFPELP